MAREDECNPEEPAGAVRAPEAADAGAPGVLARYGALLEDRRTGHAAPPGPHAVVELQRLRGERKQLLEVEARTRGVTVNWLKRQLDKAIAQSAKPAEPAKPRPVCCRLVE